MEGDRLHAVTTEHDRMTQRAFAGLMMSDQAAIETAVRESVSTAWFSDPICEAIASACFSLHDAASPIDSISVTAEISKSGLLDKIGGPGSVASVEDDAGLPGSETYWLTELRAVWQRREAIRLLSRFQRDVMAGDCDPIHEAGSILSQIAAMSRATSPRKPWKEYILEAIDDAEAALEGSPRSSGVPIGLTAFDRETGGVAPGLVVVAAETSGGKSLLMTQMAIALARATNKPALIASLEMGGKEIAQRSLASNGNVPLSFLTAGKPGISPAEYQKFFAAAQSLMVLPIALEYCPGATSGQIRAMAMDAAGSTGLSCVVIDYVQLMGFDGRADNREQAVSETVRRLKVMQGELQCPVIVASQLNDEGRLRESRAIGMHADEVYHIKHDPESGESKIVFVKRRQGARGNSIPVRMVGEKARFEDV